MIDALAAYAIVAAAAAFVVWKLFVPVRFKTILWHTAAGKEAPCAPDAATSGCGEGCPGCGLAGRRN
ncbi:MAG: hypothetical protein AB7F96_03195 [Beijerinckiaceae bacterium]